MVSGGDAARMWPEQWRIRHSRAGWLVLWPMFHDHQAESWDHVLYRAVWGWASPSAQVKSSTHFINVLEGFREERKWTDLRYMLAVGGTVHRELAQKCEVWGESQVAWISYTGMRVDLRVRCLIFNFRKKRSVIWLDCSEGKVFSGDHSSFSRVGPRTPPKRWE